MESIVFLQSKINSTSQIIKLLQEQVTNETNEINSIKESINSMVIDQQSQRQMHGRHS